MFDAGEAGIGWQVCGLPNIVTLGITAVKSRSFSPERKNPC